MDDFERQEYIGDDWQNAWHEGTDYLVPLRFDQVEIDKFVRDNVCALCRSHLVIYPYQGAFAARCPEHGPILQHNHVAKATVRKIESNESVTRMELIAEENKKKPGRTDQDILRELGF